MLTPDNTYLVRRINGNVNVAENSEYNKKSCGIQESNIKVSIYCWIKICICTQYKLIRYTENKL